MWLEVDSKMHNLSTTSAVTVLHIILVLLVPAGLVDEDGGKRQIVVDVDDVLLKRETKSIPRADVADIAVQCLGLQQALNRSFDAITLKAGEVDTVNKNVAELLNGMPKNCDYSINSQLATAAV